MSSEVPTRLIVEADGGSRGNPGPAAFGALVRDADTGLVLFEIGESVGVATNNVAEYRGLLAGLEAAREIAPGASVEARLDSKLVVEQMSGRWKIKNAELRSLAQQVDSVYPAGQVTYTWVPRSQNAAADALLNRALDGTPTRRFVSGESAEDPPSSTTGTRPGDRRNRLPAWSADELGPPTRLYLVRHGHTSATVARLFSGGGLDGPALTDAGLAEARRAGTFIAAHAAAPDYVDVGGVAAVVASPTTRTTQTAAAIAEALGAEVRTDDDWREVDFGEWEGLTLAEVMSRYPTESAAWFESVTAEPPGGESIDAMTRRISVARDRAVADYPRRGVVVVTHSMPIRALVRTSLQAGPSAMFRLQPAPGSVTVLDVFADGTPVVTSLNIRP